MGSWQWSVVRVKFGVWRVELSHRGDWVRIAVRSAAYHRFSAAQKV